MASILHLEHPTVYESSPPKNYEREALAGRFDSTPTSTLFFSSANVDALHEAIRYGVWQQSNQQEVVGRQSDGELLIIMRSVYLLELADAERQSINKPDPTLEQVRYLNAAVLEYAVPFVLKEVAAFKHYIAEVDQVPVPLAHPTSASSAGLKNAN